ncbi:hypothetical protein LPC08_16280 [Roseomonas sp. OT10]|uniref:hypothetical protein n=1 Tax=Roseomonas cutis TaxID=2897332 RepID=UPI001E5795E3|nr:hypothetical protein [Roseomonas sp. OT10]UFN47565.1 hypothetical protein LPC08_16280 [Roseomonas sp. OT10]
MPNAEDIRWFKEQFHQEIEAAVAGTPFDLDMLAALACQETGEVWPLLRRKGMPREQILPLCVGDTLDADRGRSAFPRTKADLLARPNGQVMFDLAHAALVAMAAHIPSYAAVSKRPNKFCRGFGLFQLDLQFFESDPDYFLERRYERFDQTLGRCLGELRDALRKLGFQDRRTLTDFEFACVAIAYNTGGFRPQKGLRQGFQNDAGRFYGEEIFAFVQLARTVPLPGAAAAIPAPPPGQAIVPPPQPVTATGPMLLVDTREGMLRLRSAPEKTEPPGQNVLAHLPDGHPVQAVGARAVNGFREVETSLSGALLRGFASTKFLRAAPEATGIPVEAPAPVPPATGIVAVTMPRRPGTVTLRRDLANAHSLNEPRQPGRAGTTPSELVAEIAAIVAWLDSEDPDHLRYKPRSGLTFCNIYAHDFCHLAGAYLPRVWWTQRALLQLAQGATVPPLIGDTITEMRANDLFRWLRASGASFGWRQAGTLDELQQAANQGALGLIVARRKEDGRSGHIVMVVPETAAAAARRNPAGEITAPLQSQAGASNFRYGTGRANWWRGDEFAESAFWIHA